MERTDTHKVALKFFDFEVSPEKLTELLQLEPTETGVKGQVYFIGPKQRIQKEWPYNFWMYQTITKDDNCWIGDLFADFLNSIILPRRDTIKEITSACSSELSIVQYIYHGCNPGLHFTNEQLLVLHDIKSELDIDIYVLSNDKE